MPHPPKLHRITTEFIDEEDRLKITGISEDKETLIFWFTQRLLSRLIIHCVSWLDEASPELTKAKTINRESRTEYQGLVQESARQSLQKEDAVIATLGSKSLLVKEVDVNLNDEGALFVFKEGNKKIAELALNVQHLRQWLIIIHNLWQKANWPMAIWPDWIIQSGEEELSSSVHVH